MRTQGDRVEARSGVIAIIPARGGSKGVVGKNLRGVGGVSLIARAVASAVAASQIDRVLVSTDDPAIAEEARRAGAEPMSRAARLSGDTVGSEAVLLDVLERITARPEVVVFMQATSPFIDPADLDGAVGRVRAGEADVVFAGVETHAFLWSGGPDSAVGLNHDHTRRLRRQDREPQFQETGAFYVMRAKGFAEARFRFFGRIRVAAVDPRGAGEIDSEADLDVARAIAPLIDRPHPIDVDAVVTDFDGVHTDDRVIVDQDGRESVIANRSDGQGIAWLREAGVPVLILSKEVNGVVAARAEKLGVEVRHGIDDKAGELTAWLTANGLDPSRVAYLGNDLNDLPPMAIVGWPLAVADAHPGVRDAARLVLSAGGGHGAVRELADRVIDARRSDRSPAVDQASHPVRRPATVHSNTNGEVKPWRFPLARTR